MPGDTFYPDPKFPLTRYLGKVCDKHPELNGSRRRNSGVCHGCQMDRNKKYRQRLDVKIQRATQARHERAEIKEDVAVARAIKESFHNKIKTKARQIAREAGQDPLRDWGQYYQPAVDALREEGVIPKSTK